MTASQHNALMTNVDGFTKGVQLVPTVKALTAEGCAHLLFKHVYRWHAMPDSIASDRDKLFTGDLVNEHKNHRATYQRR